MVGSSQTIDFKTNLYAAVSQLGQIWCQLHYTVYYVLEFEPAGESG